MKHLFCAILFACTTLTYGQAFTKLALKIGPSIAGQNKTPKLWNDGGVKYGLAVAVEPTIFSFGPKKQFDFNTDFSLIQKGGYNYCPVYSYDQWGHVNGIGSSSDRVTLNYFSVSPTLKLNFLKILFVKAGPRLDVLMSYKIKDKFNSDPRTSKDFNAATYGISYGAGIYFGKKKTRFIIEFDGQNDFSESSYNPASGQTFKNYCFLINFGVNFQFAKKADQSLSK